MDINHKYINYKYMDNKIIFVNTITTDLGKTHNITIQPPVPKIIVSPWNI